MRVPAYLAAGLTVLIVSGSAFAAQPSASTAPAAKQTEERQICRRVQESGSIARVRRVCYTRAQWDRLAERERSNSPGMSAMSGGTNSGN